MELYKVVYNEEDTEASLYGISIVDNPANEYEFIKLDKYKPLKLSSEDKLKKILTGVVLVPNQKILRGNKDGSTYELFFESDTIEKFSQDFLKKGYQRNSTYNHDDNKWLNGTTVVESWIVEDPNNDKSNALGFKDLPKGTWMISMKLTDELWDEYINSGKANGFSIDSYVQLEQIKLSEFPPFHDNCKCELVNGEIKTSGKPCDYCQEQINKLNLNKQSMNKNETVLASLSRFFGAIKQKVQLSSFEVEGIGTLMADNLEVGTIVYKDENGELIPLLGMEFVKDGKVYVTDELGAILSVEPILTEEVMMNLRKFLKMNQLSDAVEDITDELVDEVEKDVEDIDVESLKAKIAELEAKLADIMKEKEDVLKENVELQKYSSTRLKSNEVKSRNQESTLDALRRVINK
jgi:hypothetical protein